MVASSSMSWLMHLVPRLRQPSQGPSWVWDWACAAKNVQRILRRLHSQQLRVPLRTRRRFGPGEVMVVVVQSCAVHESGRGDAGGVRLCGRPRAKQTFRRSGSPAVSTFRRGPTRHRSCFNKIKGRDNPDHQHDENQSSPQRHHHGQAHNRWWHGRCASPLHILPTH